MLSDPDFLELLEEFRILLQESEVERYNYFSRRSPEGRGCIYAEKSLEVFRQKNQRQILEMALRHLCQELGWIS